MKSDKKRRYIGGLFRRNIDGLLNRAGTVVDFLVNTNKYSELISGPDGDISITIKFRGAKP